MDEKKMVPTRQWLISQIESLKRDIQRSEGGIILCSNMLAGGCFVEEEKDPKEEKEQKKEQAKKE